MSTKVLFVLFLFLIFKANYVIAQTQSLKGNIILGANLINYGYSYSKNKVFIDDSLVLTTIRESDALGLNQWINGGYFISDNFVVGMGYGKRYPFGVEILIKPFLRYYFSQNTNCFSYDQNKSAFFIESVFFLTSQVLNVFTKQDVNTKRFSAEGDIGIGYTKLISHTLAFEILGMYHVGYFWSKNIYYNRNYVSTGKRFDHNINLLLGLQFYFNRKTFAK